MSSRVSSNLRYIQPLLVTLSGFIGFIPLMVMPVMVGVFVDYQGLSQKVAGIVCTMQLFGVSIGILLLSRYTSRFGLKHNVRYAGVLVVLVESVSLLSESLPWICIFRFLSGLGGGIIAGCTYTWLSKSKEPDRGFGLFLLIQFLLGALLLYLIPYGLPTLGVGALKIPLVVFAVLAVILSGVFSDESETTNPSEPDNGGQVSFREMLKGDCAIKALLSVGLFELAMAMVWAHVERVGISWGLDASVISQTLAIATLAGILGAFSVVVLGAKLGRSVSIVLGVFLVVGVLISLVINDRSFILFGASLFLFNAAWAFTVPYLQGVQASLGEGAGVVCLGAFVITVSLSLGPALSGLVVESFGLLGVVVAAIAFLAVSVYFALSTISFQMQALK